MIDMKPTEEIPGKQKSEEETQPDIESDVGVETKKKLLKKLTKPKEPTDKIIEAKEKEITDETTMIVTEEIIELPEDINLEQKEKPKKKKMIRKSKPDEEKLVDESIEEIETTKVIETLEETSDGEQK
ncbi:hypothetical protein BLA29_013303, partial [Euroglyphus maynei]